MSLRADVTATFAADGSDPFAVDAAFAVGDGESLVILGPSGSGKSLLLETVAGFHPHDGRVVADGRPLDGVPPERRGFGVVFQDYALFPHMTARENAAYGTRYREGTRDPDTLLDELGVGDLADRYPPTLSGGEKQRVALARALAVRPSVMLLDEPLAALDVPTRRSLRDDLADVLADVTAVHVTHDRTTARALGDRIAVMRDGGIVQTGTPEAVFERPASPAVAAFTGGNVIPLAAAPSLRDRLDGVPPDGRVAVRPEAIGVGAPAGTGPEGGAGTVAVRARVERVVREEATSRVTLSFDDVTVEAFAADPPSPGAEVRLALPRDRIAAV
ncbi:MAG: ABC transporter ATP-binding protein [Haloferacaceae archaeon]